MPEVGIDGSAVGLTAAYEWPFGDGHNIAVRGRPVSEGDGTSWQAALVASKHDLQEWVLEALRQLGGQGSVVEVCKVVWNRHEEELEQSGDLFYTWQYDIRWAAQQLRDAGRLEPVHGQSRPWTMARFDRDPPDHSP